MPHPYNELKIFAFTLNTNDIKLCNKTKRAECADAIKSSSKCSYCKKHNCHIPAFFEYLVQYVKAHKYDIVFIATQNDSFKDDNNLHNQYLKEYFSVFGRIIDHKQTTGRFQKNIITKTTQSYKLLKSGLSTSIFFSNDYLKHLGVTRGKNIMTIKTDYIPCNKLLYRTKGGLYTTVQFSDTNTISFVNINLRKTGIKTKTRNSYVQNILSNISNGVKKKDRIDTLICCGCFNYDNINEDIGSNLTDSLSDSIKDTTLLNWADKQIYETINRGSYELPFYPTCTLKQTRTPDYDKCQTPEKYKKEQLKIKTKVRDIEKKLGIKVYNKTISSTSLDDKRIKLDNILKKDRKNIQCPYESVDNCGEIDTDAVTEKIRIYYKQNKKEQWCERILYSDNAKDPKITCDIYKSFDFGQFMANSKHKSVYGGFTVKMT